MVKLEKKEKRKKEPQSRTKMCFVFFLVLELYRRAFREGRPAARPEPGGSWLRPLWQCHHAGVGHGLWGQLLHAGPGERARGLGWRGRCLARGCVSYVCGHGLGCTAVGDVVGGTEVGVQRKTTCTSGDD